MNTELSPETLRIDMGEVVQRFSVKPDNYLDRIVRDFRRLGQIGFSCEDLMKLKL